MQPVPQSPDIPNFNAFASREELAEALAKEVAADLAHGIEANGKAALAVSGGSTPKPFFEALKQQPLTFSSLDVTVADERWVPATDEDSNEKLVRDHLLTDGARFISLYNGASSAEAGEEVAEEALRKMGLPFDVVILGMGPDGHTASLFPGHPRLEDALGSEHRLCFGITDAPKPPPERMTLTKHALLQTRRLILHITGTDKKQVLEEALKPGPVSELPIRAFLHQDDVPLEIYWAA